MKSKISILFIVISSILFLSCNNNQPANSNRTNANAGIKTGVEPIADPEIAVIEMENAGAFGTIKIELYSNIAPLMVARFKELTREGVYNGTTFHRINPQVIQGGDPLSKDNDPRNDGSGKSDKPNVPAEFSDIPFTTGIVGAARGQDNDSANSQFFIMLTREAGFDNRYTVFGKVIEGMNNVRTIGGVQPKERERPLENVVIKSITIQPR
jgi:cyclophilin family peptidyl-prolyl cis-trans isomerase